MWCNTEAVHLHNPYTHVGNMEFVVHLETFNFDLLFFITCLTLAHGPHNRPGLLTLACSRVLKWVVEALLKTHFRMGELTVGGVGGVLASLTTMVKECWGSSFLITLSC